MPNLLPSRLRSLASIALAICALGIGTATRANATQLGRSVHTVQTARTAHTAGPDQTVVTAVKAVRARNLKLLCSTSNPASIPVLYPKAGKGCLAQMRAYIKHHPKYWSQNERWAKSISLALVKAAVVDINGSKATVSWSVTKQTATGSEANSTVFTLSLISHRWLIDYEVQSQVVTSTTAT